MDETDAMVSDTATEKPLKKEGDTVGTTERAIRLLQFIAESGDFSLKSAAHALNLPPSTVHRMLQLLNKLDLVARYDKQTYRIGREFYRMGSLAAGKFDLNAAAHPQLKEIFSRFQETCSFALYLPSTRRGMIVETLTTPHPLQYRIDPFIPWSLVWGALGRTMLAYLPDEDIRAALSEAEPSPATGQPAPTLESLAEELAAIRANGYYVSINQNVKGATGTAAAVLGTDGRLIGSLGLTIPVARYDPNRQPEISNVILEQARALSAALGHGGH